MGVSWSQSTTGTHGAVDFPKCFDLERLSSVAHRLGDLGWLQVVPGLGNFGLKDQQVASTRHPRRFLISTRLWTGGAALGATKHPRLRGRPRPRHRLRGVSGEGGALLVVCCDVSRRDNQPSLHRNRITNITRVMPGRDLRAFALAGPRVTRPFPTSARTVWTPHSTITGDTSNRLSYE